jgi:hypothetical protein
MVQRRKFEKVKRNKQSFQQKKIIKKQVSPLVIKGVWIAAFVIIFVYVLLYVLRITVLSPEYTIKQVDYATESIQMYDNPYLYKAISDSVKDKNYSVEVINKL